MGRVLLGTVLALGLLASGGPTRAEDEPVPIGEVVADPDTYHFRHIVMQGTVRQVTPLPPYMQGPDTTCYGAYTFLLEDGTGSIEVSVLGICGTPVLRKPEVVDGETIVLVAQILSPNRLMSASKQEGKRLHAVANEIRHVVPPGSPPDEAASTQTEEPTKPERNGKPEGASGY